MPQKKVSSLLDLTTPDYGGAHPADYGGGQFMDMPQPSYNLDVRNYYGNVPRVSGGANFPSGLSLQGGYQYDPYASTGPRQFPGGWNVGAGYSRQF